MSRLRWPLLLGLAWLQAASAAPTYEDTVEPYVVRPGDTISAITLRFLGDALFWEDNWKLNPSVQDPDRLRIGQVLRIIVKRKVIAESAEVIQAVNRTEKMLQQPHWEPARSGDALRSGQGLRTGENSVAELRFNAETQLRLDPFSQVFLARKDTSLRGIERGQVTVEQGAVDLRFAPLKKSRSELQIGAGPATATPQASAERPATLRAGTTDEGGAKVMVFAGQSRVEAGGHQVEVAQGQGTRVPESGPPAPPEALLPAPPLQAAMLHWNYSNGRLNWHPVAGAARYQLQVCADRDCLQPEQRATVEAAQTHWQVAPLPLGQHFWRVHALSASDLDGYPSALGEILVSDARPDLQGPMLALQPVEGFVVSESEPPRLGANAAFRVWMHDEASGPDQLWVDLGDGQWQPWQQQPVRLSALRGTRLQLRASDQLGNRSLLQVELQHESSPSEPSAE